ncbi:MULTISPECIES: hypothetical protein [unclassified Bacillus (in: firmicutes)]|uniref:hypothetical protein n=1 Tax=unclassified Bacillus (in: firmicutes) TaxID=185979 RepID=UPI001BED00C8|nr:MULTISPECIES: hypothetical protein [unclassified Bacillus (in: firmicutes)]MBT2638436.1 hypothetical protein [Bacillus sp. ISL-39]MBT2662199.1 hypothetical protein [Bacillus sp. ISL-45]
MIKFRRAFGLVVAGVFLLSACSASFSEQKADIKEEVAATFESQPEKTNNSTKDIDYYLPTSVKVDKETPNNVLLKDGEKTYILFYNQHELEDSKVVYDSTVKQQKEWDANETFSKDGKFGYLLVKKLKENHYQLIVGIGGVKLTTETENVKEDAEAMMQIANSVKMN